MDVPHASEAEQQNYFDKAFELALGAEQKTGTHSVSLRVADSIVRLVFAGQSLVPHLLPALGHLRIDTNERADLTLHLWDSETSGTDMLPPPCPRDRFTDRGDIWGFTSNRFKLAFHWGEFSINLMDLERGVGIYRVPTATTLPYWVNASPLRTPLHWWMEKKGRQLLHAAAVSTQDGAILITGKGGVGKSTTALACLAAGLTYLADDYLIVGLDPVPTVYSLYSTAKLDPDQVKRFPHLARYVSNGTRLNDEKAVIFLHPDFDEQIALSAPLVAVATPHISGRPETRFSPTSQQALRRAAAFTTLSQLPNAGGRTHDFICRLIGQLPGLELTLGTNLERVPKAIAGFLQDPARVIKECQSALAPQSSTQLPLITVIIPVYNGAQFIRDAISNVLSQGYPALEIIVVNDGSTDNTAEVLKGLSVDIRCFEQENLGPAAARNRGIKDASGDYVAFLDVDDLWPENNLSRLLDVLRSEPALEVVHGHAQVMELDPATQRYEYVGNPNESFPYSIAAALYRRRVFQRVGLFDADLIFGEDTDWYKRAEELEIGIKRLEEVTLLVRRHTQNMTRGKSLVEVNGLRVFKKALDRSRNHVARDA